MASDEGKGRKDNQKLKTYLILSLLQKETDAAHVMNADEIAAKIQSDYEISAERRSVYRDIDAINAAVLLAHGDASTIGKANKYVADGQKTIVYDAARRGYYYDNIFADFEDVRLAAECIYAAKFIDKARAEKIIEEIICKDVSKYLIDDVKRDIFVSDRWGRTNKALYRTIETITEAMRHRTEDDPDNPKKYKHKPEQISFHYLTHTLGDMENEIERGKGAEYIVSPHQLMVCDGNYYLLAYNPKVKHSKIRTYRVDRMTNVKRIKGSEREGSEEVREIDLEAYTRTHFSMFEGDAELVTIRFTNDLLDTAYDRFGSRGAHYAAYDPKHFTVTTKVHLSNPFYGWVFGFGKKAKIISPQRAIDDFKQMVNTLSDMYNPEETE